jgi:hypothetical protein
MLDGFLDIAMTPSVKAAQRANGSGEYWESFKGRRRFDRFTDAEKQFIASRGSFTWRRRRRPAGPMCSIGVTGGLSARSR